MFAGDGPQTQRHTNPTAVISHVKPLRASLHTTRSGIKGEPKADVNNPYTQILPGDSTHTGSATRQNPACMHHGVQKLQTQRVKSTLSLTRSE